MFSRLLSTAKNIFTKPETSNPDRIPDSTGRRSSKKRGTPRATPKVTLRGSPRSSRASSPTKKPPGRSKLSQTTSTTRNPATGRKEVKMVTTRRQSGALFGASKDTSAATSDNEINEDEIAYELLTQSAQKRRREKAREAGEETPSKRRKLPVRTKGDKKEGEVEVHSHLAVEIPLNEVESDGSVTNHGVSNVAAKLSAASSNESTPSGTPTERKRGRSSKKEAEAQKAHAENMRKVNELKEILTAAKEKDSESNASEDEEETPEPEPSKAQKQAAKLSPPVVETPVEEEQKELATPPKPKHKKFGDDDVAEPIPFPEPLVKVIEGKEDAESGSEEDDSDDDAPEEVGGKAAQEKAQEAVRNAANAAEQKEVAERQRRQGRDAELKKQAKAAKKRRHVEAAEEAALAAAEEEQDGDESMTLQDDDSSPVPDEAQPSKKIKFDRFNLPAELPEDFLEDKGSDDEMMDVEEERGHKLKKIKFVDEKKVKDLRLGHTTFRVQKQKKAGLAPKANARAKALKEALMGKRKGQAEFRKTPTGFFSGRK